MSTDTRQTWAPTGPFPQRVKLRNGLTATLYGYDVVGYLIGLICGQDHERKWFKNGLYARRPISDDHEQYDIIGPAEEELNMTEIKEELERLREENARLKLLTPPEPPGPWQKTHRIVAVRSAKKGEAYINSIGEAVYACSDHEEWCVSYILEPLEPPKPAFVCPPHLVGFGSVSRSENGNLFYWCSPETFKSIVVSRDGEITDIGQAMGFTSLPDLQPGQELEL